MSRTKNALLSLALIGAVATPLYAQGKSEPMSPFSYRIKRMMGFVDCFLPWL